MKIIIGGDVVPTPNNYELFIDGKVTELIGDELAAIWNTSDIRIFNLETPIVDKSDPIDKCGPNLMAPKSTIKGIKALNPSLLTLANNHILDQNIQGMYSTINLLNCNNISYVGVGKDLNEASQPYIIEKNGIKIGVYACAEHEFSIATKSRPGANPFDPLESPDHIYELKKKCDFIIVLYHGGKEHYRYPSPYLQKVCKKLVDKGADIIVCQHSHCIGCYEEYKGSTIIYGQGNFIFNKYDNEFWNNGMLVEITIDKESYHVNYIPFEKVENKIRLAKGEKAKEILHGFKQRSFEIKENQNIVEEKYLEFAQKMILNYLYSLSGFGKWLSRVDRKLLKNFLLKRLYNKQKLLAIQNYIECEAHRELVITGLKSIKSN